MPKPKPDQAPDEVPMSTVVDVATPQTVEGLREAHKTPAWLFAAAKMKHGWAQGAELTEPAYLAALEAAANEVIR